MIELNVVSAISNDEPAVEIVGIGMFSTATSHFVSLLPGAHRLRSVRAEWPFSVNLNATVDYAPAMNEVLLGRDTATLVVLGVPGEPPDTMSRVVNLGIATKEGYPMGYGAQALVLELVGLALNDHYEHVDASLMILRAYIQLIEKSVAAGDVARSRGRLLLDRAALIERELVRLR